MESKKKFQTKEQLLYRLQEGISFGDGEEHTPESYMEMASKFSSEWRQAHYPHHKAKNLKVEDKGQNKSQHNDEDNMTPENLERDYWDLVELNSHQVTVEYGNDIDTTEYWSGFPLSERGRSMNGTKKEEKVNLPEPEFGSEDYYKETGWNLNNIPCCQDSILRHVKIGINGINVPWLYFGCLFSTFCWHNEDNYLYSINYHHKGAPKQWYGVPGTRKDAEGLEKVFKNYLSMKMRDVPDLLHHITTMFSPRLLQQGGVPVCKVIQYPGEYVVTFPRSFHGGFSMGPGIGEAVNFATHNWISFGADASERYRSFARASVFSHDRLTSTMANHLSEQTNSSTCEHLLKELYRVIDEELKLRQKLIESGVRDVSADINLPKNRLDQLDEESADYDDKRLCHSCKHVCFFSAVACHCSQSKVSCLRHSHYLCRCPVNKKYILIWSTENEMKNILEATRQHCENLKRNEELTKSEKMTTPNNNALQNYQPLENTPSYYVSNDQQNNHEMTRAPGALRDLKLHQYDDIPCRAITKFDAHTTNSASPNHSVPSTTTPNIVEVIDESPAKKIKLSVNAPATTNTHSHASIMPHSIPSQQ